MKEFRFGFGDGDKRESNIPEPLVSVTNSNKHGDISKDSMDGFWVATLEKLAFILKYEVVQLRITGNYSWWEE